MATNSNWTELVTGPEERVLPWFGSRRVHERQRTWQVSGALPLEHGWHRFRLVGRRAEVAGDGEAMPFDFEVGQRTVVGYLIGDRLVPDAARVRGDIGQLDGLVQATRRVRLIERGLARFGRVRAFEDKDGELVFVREELALGPESEVDLALQEGRGLADIKGVLPALDLAFRWWVRQRQRAEDNRRHIEREAARVAAAEAAAAELEAERQAQRTGTTGAERRRLAGFDIEAAARAALALSGATLLDVRQAPRQREVIVTYRFRGTWLQCVVDARTLRVIDAGVCLTDHATHERGDGYFTLESLPAVIAEAMDEDKLVVWRHTAE